MGIFDDGNTDCVRNLLKPVERVLRAGVDVYRESFESRKRLWQRIEDAYNRYLEEECGSFLTDLDQHFRAKFEGALALLALSFKKNGEIFAPAERRYSDREIAAIERIFRYNVFEIYTKDDILKKIMHRDTDVLGMMREYYHGLDKWIEDVLNDPEVSLSLRLFLKEKWDSYKGKINEAIKEATERFDWFRDFLEEADIEKKSVEKVYRSKLREKEAEVEKLREHLREMVRGFEEERRSIIERMERAKEAELERLRREKEEMIKRFEEEKARLVEEISRMKDEELKRRLEEELRKAQEEMIATVRDMEQRIRRKELELRRKEQELLKKEKELEEREETVEEKIKAVLKVKTEKGTRFVRMDEARMLEMNFVGRIRSKMRGQLRILGRTFKVESVREIPTFDKTSLVGKLSDRDLKNVPDNRLVEVLLKEKKLLGKKEEILVKAMFYGRPEKYARLGFDTDPLELADVNALLVDAREEAGNGRIVLLIASPTGFESRILNYVNSSDFHRNFISEKVSLALLDLMTGELTINPNDEYAKAFEPMLRLERDEELIKRVRGFIETKLIARGYVRLEDVTSEFPENVATAVFATMSREKGYTTKYVDGIGYVLVKEGFL